MLVRKLPVSETLSNVALRTFLLNPETYVESELQDLLPIVAEYITWLYVCAHKEPPARFVSDYKDFEIDLERTIELLVRIVGLVQHYYLLGHDGRDSFEDILNNTRISNLLIRGFAFRHHLSAQLHSLLDPFRADLCQLVGFDVDQALRIYNGLERLVNARILFYEQRIHDYWSKTVATTLPLHKRGLGSEAEAEMRSRLLKTLTPVAHSVFQVNCQDLVKVTKLEPGVVRKLMDFFSTGFGQREVADGWPSVYEPLDRAPLLKLSDDLWLAHLGQNLLWAFKNAFEYALHQDLSVWNRYEPHRSRYLEKHAVNMIASTSLRARGWTHLKYDFDDGEGVREYELDGLVLVDRTAFLVEAKAGAMSAAARRGSASAIDQLKRLVGEAQQQSARAARFIRSTEEATFGSPKGEICVRGKNLSRIYLVSVTLDCLTAFVTNLSALARAGLIKGGEMAWSVYELDLQVITELVSGVGEFVSYLDRRMAVGRIEAITTEELDWFGCYLLYDLRPDRLLAGKKVAILGSTTQPIHDYYQHILGKRRTPSPKPKQDMPKTMRSLIENLERNAPSGFVDAVAVLLKQTREERNTFAKCVDEMWLSVKRKRDLAFRTKLGSGSVLCYAHWRKRDRGLLKKYTQAAKYAMESDNAVCILQTTRQGALVGVEKYPWKKDVSLEMLSRTLFAKMGSHITVR